MNGCNGGAFNPTNKKTALLDLNDDKNSDLQVSFQPLNFTNTRPKQLNGVQQPSTIQINHQQQNGGNTFVTKASNFKRDIIAEKKRSSIGKYPNYLNNNNVSSNLQQVKSNEYFQPIQVQHSQPVNNQSQQQQTARERLFGINNQSTLAAAAAASEAELMNSRKIAMVKPEQRGGCSEKYLNFFLKLYSNLHYIEIDFN